MVNLKWEKMDVYLMLMVPLLGEGGCLLSADGKPLLGPTVGIQGTDGKRLSNYVLSLLSSPSWLFKIHVEYTVYNADYFQ